MKISHNGESFRVRFTYRSGNKTGGQALANLKGKRITTEAIVSRKVGEDWIEVTRGQSHRNRLDAFNKGLGRRIALQNAFATEAGKALGREVRTVLWDEYFNLHRDSRTLMVGDFKE